MTRPFVLGEIHDTVPDEDGVEYATISFDTPGKTDIVYCLPQQAIPVIFLPGIMGSPLIATGDNRGMWPQQGKWAWCPDDNGWMVRGYGNLRSAQRRRLLNPAAVRALEDTSEADKKALQANVTGLAVMFQ